MDDADTASQQRSGEQLSPDAIEGCLIAHRTVLALLLAYMQLQGGAAPVIETLESLAAVEDDPNVPAVAAGGPEVIQGFLAQEIRAVLIAASPERILLPESG
jgi:hypothetical protein